MLPPRLSPPPRPRLPRRWLLFLPSLQRRPQSPPPSSRNTILCVPLPGRKPPRRICACPRRISHTSVMLPLRSSASVCWPIARPSLGSSTPRVPMLCAVPMRRTLRRTVPIRSPVPPILAAPMSSIPDFMPSTTPSVPSMPKRTAFARCVVALSRAIVCVPRRLPFVASSARRNMKKTLPQPNVAKTGEPSAPFPKSRVPYPGRGFFCIRGTWPS